MGVGFARHGRGVNDRDRSTDFSVPLGIFRNREAAMTYRRFAAMIAVSTLVMYGLMYLNTYQLEHVRFSETRL
jgi:hypothetical protein